MTLFLIKVMAVVWRGLVQGRRTQERFSTLEVYFNSRRGRGVSGVLVAKVDRHAENGDGEVAVRLDGVRLLVRDNSKGTH